MGEEEVDKLEYDDQVTDSLDTAAGLSEADLDQATRVEVIQEGWGNAAKTGLIIIGALAVLGAGAMILKSMSKRESPQKAKPEHFFKVTAAARRRARSRSAQPPQVNERDPAYGLEDGVEHFIDQDADEQYDSTDSQLCLIQRDDKLEDKDPPVCGTL